MRKLAIFTLVIILFMSCSNQEQNFDNTFTFIAAADMRYYATEKYRSPKHFLGVVEAIKRVGKGKLMISPGDTDPPSAARKLIDEVLGEDYLWYPVMGNHELESTEYTDWLKQYNKGGLSLANIVRKGPPGCEETTFSFDWENCHFVGINQYYDGKSDVGADGNVVPELLDWLEADLAENKKKHVFVYGHEPIISMPDLDNGRIRHQGDSLDKYPLNLFRFIQILNKYRVTAYICGHSHSTSFGYINGVCQIDVGHARGIEEDSAPEELFLALSQTIEKNINQATSEGQVLINFYNSNKKQVQKALFFMKLAPGKEYKEIKDKPGILGLTKFYNDYKKGGEKKKKLYDTFWGNSQYRKSSFIKFYAGAEKVKIEIYRDDAHGGAYSLQHSFILD